MNHLPNTSEETSICLSVRDLSLKYGETTAFTRVNLQIKRSEVTAIVGPSGCGKSSFLQSLNRLTDNIPECYVSGEILFHEQNIRDQQVSVRALRQKIGMIFQKPNPFPFSIYRNFTIPLNEFGIKDKKIIDEKIEKVLLEVGLWEEVKDRLLQNAATLSGGQQQRLCIARALILEPEILLMDEPCSALDPLSTKVIEQLILNLKNNYTVIIVTHNLAQAKRVADTAALFWIKEGVGNMIETASVQKFFNNPNKIETQSYISGFEG